MSVRLDALMGEISGVEDKKTPLMMPIMIVQHGFYCKEGERMAQSIVTGGISVTVCRGSTSGFWISAWGKLWVIVRHSLCLIFAGTICNAPKHYGPIMLDVRRINPGADFIIAIDEHMRPSWCIVGNITSRPSIANNIAKRHVIFLLPCFINHFC